MNDVFRVDFWTTAQSKCHQQYLASGATIMHPNYTRGYFSVHYIPQDDHETVVHYNRDKTIKSSTRYDG